ncbi:carbohydrate ABC transporter permease [Cohnella sp. GCM10027633]|uniref:carbohydrate ABC transporter permease n=1 Tax=unclassified Cohnella TaxID=2636738 RepID=UPI003643A2B5
MTAKTNKLTMRGRRELTGWLFVSPMLLVFLTFVVYPILQAFKSSLYGFDYTSYYWNGFGNYAAILSDSVFLRAVRTTLWFVVLIVPTQTLIALAVSLTINRFSNRAQSFYKAVFYVPAVTSVVSLAMVWEYIYNNQFGFANYALKSVGLAPVNWLGIDFGVYALALIVVTISVGAAIVVLSAGLNGIPREIYESASIDGASPGRTLWRITLPLLKPSLLYVLVTSTIASFQIFTIILLMTGGGPAYKTTTMLMLIYREAFINMNFGAANAMGIILCLIITSIALLQFRLMKTDIEY